MEQAKVGRVILSLAATDAILAVAGLIVHPIVRQENGVLGALANVLILTFCAYVALRSPISIQRADSRTWRFATFAGFAIGGWLGADLISNYFIYRDGATNQKVSFIVYGLYLAALLFVAAKSAIEQRRFLAGVASAICYIVPAQLIWHLSEFASFYCLGQTQVGRRFLAEEMRQDFERSGSRSFEAFTMGDFYGAGFLHIVVIGFLFAVVFGSFASLFGLAWVKARAMTASSSDSKLQ